MQEEVLRLILLALEDGSALSRKVLVLFVVQRLEKQYPPGLQDCHWSCGAAPVQGFLLQGELLSPATACCLLSACECFFPLKHIVLNGLEF